MDVEQEQEQEQEQEPEQEQEQGQEQEKKGDRRSVEDEETSSDGEVRVAAACT